MKNAPWDEVRRIMQDVLSRFSRGDSPEGSVTWARNPDDQLATYPWDIEARYRVGCADGDYGSTVKIGTTLHTIASADLQPTPVDLATRIEWNPRKTLWVVTYGDEVSVILPERSEMSFAAVKERLAAAVEARKPHMVSHGLSR